MLHLFVVFIFIIQVKTLGLNHYNIILLTSNLSLHFEVLQVGRSCSISSVPVCPLDLIAAALIARRTIG